MNELDKTYAKRANKIEENNWQPYYNYRISLMEDYHPPAANAASTTAATTVLGNQTANASATNNTLNGASILTNGANRRRRQQPSTPDSSINMSGVSRLKDSINVNRSRAVTGNNAQNKQIVEETINEEDAENDEEIENIQNNREVNGANDEAFNSHTESTMNGLDTLKISHINGDSTRSTRSSRTNQTANISAKVNGTAASVAQQALAKNSPNKRSRSPLVTNNNNNTLADDSMMSEANCVLTSTRIEPHRLSRGAAAAAASNKARLATLNRQGNFNMTELEQSGDINETDLSVESPAKRKRKSEENSLNEIENNGTTTRKSTRV